MALTLVPFEQQAWAVMLDWYATADSLPSRPPNAVACTDGPGNLAGAIGYHLADGGLLIVASVYLRPGLSDTEGTKVQNYLCTGVKHLATMLGRYPVTLAGPFIAKKRPQPSMTKVGGSPQQVTKPAVSNVTPTSDGVKDDLEDW